MKNLLVAIVIVAVAGCATSSSVVPMGQETYLVSQEHRGPASSMGDAQAGAFREAAEFCRDKGGDFEVINTTNVPRSFGQFPAASVQFRCTQKRIK